MLQFKTVRSVSGALARLLPLALAGAVLLPAQYHHLASTADGSVLYFSTTLRQRGTDQPFHGKLFIIAAAGLRLEEQREEIPPNVPPVPPHIPPPHTQHFSNFFDLRHPDVSSDGRIVSFTETRDCEGRGCVFPDLDQTVFRGIPAQPDDRRGTARLSPNGRFAVLTRRWSIHPVVRLNLDTGERVPLGFSNPLSPSGRIVADDGTIVVNLPRLDVWRQGQLRRYIPSYRDGTAFNPVIDAAGRTIAYSEEPYPPHYRRLRLLHLNDETKETLLEGEGDLDFPWLSDDGLRVLFLSTARFDGSPSPDVPQAFVINTDGTGLRQLTDGAGGVVRAILSGNGQVAFAVTGAGRLVRIDVESGVVTELIGRTATASLWPVPIGSVGTVTGTGFVEEPIAAGSPPPTELDGVRLTLGGIPAPLLSVSPTEIQFQVPWELADRQSVAAELETDADPSFVAPTLTANPVPLSQRFEQLPGIAGRHSLWGWGYALAAHQTFDALLTRQDGGRPGEIVHLYATGLGPVHPPALTGEPAPASPPSVLTAMPTCTILQRSLFQDLPVRYAGLAPGLVGYYLLSLHLPTNLIGGDAQIKCLSPAWGTGDLIGDIPITAAPHARGAGRRRSVGAGRGR